MKVVINGCYGGFGLSDEAMQRYADIKGIKVYPETTKYGDALFWTVPQEERTVTGLDQIIDQYSMQRDDPVLVQVVEELGIYANGMHSQLRVVDIPDDVQWTIEEYDGSEWVAEFHRTWR